MILNPVYGETALRASVHTINQHCCTGHGCMRPYVAACKVLSPDKKSALISSRQDLLMIRVSRFRKGRRCNNNRSIFRLESKVNQLEVSVVVLGANMLDRFLIKKCSEKHRWTDLDHLNGHESVKGLLKLCRDLAIVEKVNPDAVLQPHFPPLQESSVRSTASMYPLGTHTFVQPVYSDSISLVSSITATNLDGQASPAASKFEDTMARLDSCLAQDMADLAVLSSFQVL